MTNRMVFAISGIFALVMITAVIGRNSTQFIDWDMNDRNGGNGTEAVAIVPSETKVIVKRYNFG